MEETPKKERKARACRRNSLLPKRKKGVPNQWHPELVGKVPGYPKTQEIWQAKSDLMRQQIKLYNAEGITGRNGVRDGWAGQKKLIRAIQERAAAQAKEVMDELEKEGRFVPDNYESRIIMEEAFEMVLAQKEGGEDKMGEKLPPVPLYGPKERLQAMKMIWDVVQKKPISQKLIGVSPAEDFLEALSEKE